MKNLLIVLLVAMTTACAGPSKARYVELLHECRAANREHMRLVQAYDKSVERCITVRRGDYLLEKIGPLWKEKAITVCPAFTSPEPAWGAVEMGLGGY